MSLIGLFRHCVIGYERWCLISNIGDKNAADAVENRTLRRDDLLLLLTEEDGSADAPVNKAHIYDIYDDVAPLELKIVAVACLLCRSIQRVKSAD